MFKIRENNKNRGFFLFGVSAFAGLFFLLIQPSAHSDFSGNKEISNPFFSNIPNEQLEKVAGTLTEIEKKEDQTNKEKNVRLERKNISENNKSKKSSEKKSSKKHKEKSNKKIQENFSNDSVSSEETYKELVFFVDFGDKVKEFKINFKEGETVFSLMKNAREEKKLDFKSSDGGSFGEFIEEIEGIKNNENGNNYYWMFYVNGKSSNVGCSSHKLNKDDTSIKWKYETFSF